jgi:hypothetical protein
MHAIFSREKRDELTTHKVKSSQNRGTHKHRSTQKKELTEVGSYCVRACESVCSLPTSTPFMCGCEGHKREQEEVSEEGCQKEQDEASEEGTRKRKPRKKGRGSGSLGRRDAQEEASEEGTRKRKPRKKRR